MPFHRSDGRTDGDQRELQMRARGAAKHQITEVCRAFLTIQRRDRIRPLKVTVN
jgi:hypothetical protein